MIKGIEMAVRAHNPFSDASERFHASYDVFNNAGAHQILQDQLTRLRADGDKSAQLTRHATRTGGRFSLPGMPNDEYEEILRFGAERVKASTSGETGIVSKGVKIKTNQSGNVGVEYTAGQIIGRDGKTYEVNWIPLGVEVLNELARIHGSAENIPLRSLGAIDIILSEPLADRVARAINLSEPLPDSRRRI